MPFITEIERSKCQKVKEAFTELYETEDTIVLDAGKYGFVKLQYYNQISGFDCVTVFTNCKDLFNDLWDEWLFTHLLSLAHGTPMQDMSCEDIFDNLPEEKQKEIMDKKNYFAIKTGIGDILD